MAEPSQPFTTVDLETTGDRLDPSGMSHPFDPALLAQPQAIDRSGRGPVIMFCARACFWLIVGPLLALLCSL